MWDTIGQTRQLVHASTRPSWISAELRKAAFDAAKRHDIRGEVTYTDRIPDGDGTFLSFGATLTRGSGEQMRVTFVLREDDSAAAGPFTVAEVLGEALHAAAFGDLEYAEKVSTFFQNDLNEIQPLDAVAAAHP